MLGIWLSPLTPKVWSKSYPQFHFKAVIFLPDIFTWEVVFHLPSWIMQAAELSYKGGKGFMFKGFTGVTYYHWKLSHRKIIIKIFDVTLRWWKAKKVEMKMCSCGRGKDWVQAVCESSRAYCQTGPEARTAGHLVSLHF